MARLEGAWLLSRAAQSRVMERVPFGAAVRGGRAAGPTAIDISERDTRGAET